MYFKEISLYNFRNYKNEKVSFHPRANLIIGMNAQGKTNLLESLSVMSLGKSFRTANDIEMIGFENEFCRAKTKYFKEGQEREIEISYSPAGKSIQIDGIKADKTSELLDHVYTVIFSPDDLRIIKDEPEKRRRFMDRELCQLKPIYYKSLGKYKRILLQRNTLLKKEDPDEMMLDVWDKALAECGGKILYERERFVEKLDFLSRELHKKITDGKEILEV
jgi:DNA replication and repair protein RecF